MVAAVAAAAVLWSGGDNLHSGGAVAATPTDKAALIKQGEYLARAGDCIACHTVRGGTTNPIFSMNWKHELKHTAGVWLRAVASSQAVSDPMRDMALVTAL